MLFASALILLSSGLLLTRAIPLGEMRDPIAQQATYWLHVVTPLVVVWLFVLHRLAGPRIRWRAGAVIALLAGVFAVAGIYFHSQDPVSGTCKVLNRASATSRPPSPAPRLAASSPQRP